MNIVKVVIEGDSALFEKYAISLK